MTPGLTLYGRRIPWWQLALAGVGVYLLTRKKTQTAISSAVNTAERAILKKFVGNGQESYIDACFDVGKRVGVSPYLLMGYLLVESGFGAALTKGTLMGRTVYTGDFIPRMAEPQIDAFMQSHPLEGCERQYWERKSLRDPNKILKGTFWVPAYALRVAKFGSPQAAWYNNRGVPGGVGWGFTPWQLDWVWMNKPLMAGAAWEPEKATEAAALLVRDNIRILKNSGLRSGEDLLRGVVAAYNAGADGVMNAWRKNLPVENITTGSGYVDGVLKIAKAVGRTIEV